MINIKTIPDPLINFVFECVYKPSDDSYLIIDYFKKNVNLHNFDGINISDIHNILDLGTGTGIIALLIQIIKANNPNFNPKIYASDILKEAIETAKINEKLNNFEGEIIFIQSNLFESFLDYHKKSFDIIVFNPPYLPSSDLIEKNKSSVDYSWNGGVNGYNIFLDFLDQAKSFLKNKDGYIYYISSSRTNLKKLDEYIEQRGFKNKILDKKHVFFEDIVLNRLQII